MNKDNQIQALLAALSPARSRKDGSQSVVLSSDLRRGIGRRTGLRRHKTWALYGEVIPHTKPAISPLTQA